MTNSDNKWTYCIPAIFVFLWSTGFIGAKFSLPYIEPFYLLFIRVSLTSIIFALLMWWYGTRWLTGRQFFHQSVSGLLMHGAYSGGVFAAVYLGMPAGVIALLVSLQPVLTALVLCVKKPITLKQFAGLVLGFVGVVLVLFSKKSLPNFELTWQMLLAALAALLGITFGSLYQKRYGEGVSLLSASTVQYLMTALLMGGVSLMLENQVVVWTTPLLMSILWLVLGVSVLAVFLLLYMMTNGAAEKVTSYFYLVPGVTAIQAWLFFDEQFPLLAIGGVLLSLAGVYLAIKMTNDVETR